MFHVDQVVVLNVVFQWRVALQYTNIANMAGWKIMKNTSSNGGFFHGHVSFWGV